MSQGIAASPGVAIGRAFLFRPEELDIPRRTIGDSETEKEVARFHFALDKTRQQLEEIRSKSEKEAPGGYARIFKAYIMILEDPMFLDEVHNEIQNSKSNVEYAVMKVSNALIELISKLENEYVSERAVDIHDVARRVINNLLGKERVNLSSLANEVIVIAHDLSPSDTALMNKNKVVGFATDVGSRTSHTSIMARALEIPAVVGLGNITQLVKTGDLVIIDGTHGQVLINPDEEVIQDYIIQQTEFLEFEKSLDVLRDLPAITLDNYSIELAGNIEIPEEIESVLRHGAKGVGLYRTEFLYIRKQIMPSEDEQFEFYKEAAQAVAPNPIIIRTLDLGGDKFASYLTFNDDANSIMGLRAIRLCLQRPDIFIPQLRAILRASVYGNVKIMFPMISGIGELRQAKVVLEKVKMELLDQKIPYDPNLEVGAMIEVPSAVMIADMLAKECDFFSIGTNDLIQYALAVHRVNEEIAYLYEPLHPAVLRFIKHAIDAAHNAGIWIGMCGEMASDPIITPILIGMGLDELSMSPTSVPEVKKLIRSLTIKEAREMAEKVFSFSTASEVEDYVYSETMKRFPELTAWISLRSH